MLLFKLFGILLIFSVCLGIGFIKSDALKQRQTKLLTALKGTTRLIELIRMGGYEIDELCDVCFEKSFIYSKNGKFHINGEFLTDEDTAALEEFLQGFGILEPEAEQKRAKLYYNILEEQHNKAAEEYNVIGKLYRTVGLMGGLILCIFLM